LQRGCFSIKPIIGITAGGEGDYRLNRHYVDAVSAAGGVPIIIVCGAREALLACDGIILSGGGDISPGLCGISSYDPVYLDSPDPVRDRFELEIAALAFEKGIPTLGICRGLQVMNTALGGSIIFHIEGHIQKGDKDQPSHSVLVKEGGLLSRLVDKECLEVNSFHHQAPGTLSPYLAVSAVSDDGVLEAAEAVKHPFYLGVQWHPEHMEGHSSEILFAALCNAAERNRQFE